jgi:dihydrofolate reductase
LKPETRISIIAAVAANRVIGAGNKLPWHLPDDLRHFKHLTRGHAIITGRRNYESIGRPLPERHNIVVTRQRDFSAAGCTVVRSIAEALDAARDDPEIFVIGGGEIYRQTLPLAKRLYLTRVRASPPGDAFFPDYDPGEWCEVDRVERPADDRHAHAFSFVTLERRRA